MSQPTEPANPLESRKPREGRLIPNCTCDELYPDDRCPIHTPPPIAAPEPPQLPYAADWEPLWTVCSNLESILLREPRQDFPKAFHTNLKRAFALLRERYALPPSPNAQPEGLIGDNHRQVAAPVPTAEGPREHRIGVWDYQSLCDCLKHNLEQAMPDYLYRDPQDAIQTLAARVMTLQREKKP